MRFAKPGQPVPPVSLHLLYWTKAQFCTIQQALRTSGAVMTMLPAGALDGIHSVTLALGHERQENSEIVLQLSVIHFSCRLGRESVPGDLFRPLPGLLSAGQLPCVAVWLCICAATREPANVGVLPTSGNAVYVPS